MDDKAITFTDEIRAAEEMIVREWDRREKSFYEDADLLHEDAVHDWWDGTVDYFMGAALFAAHLGQITASDSLMMASDLLMSAADQASARRDIENPDG